MAKEEAFLAQGKVTQALANTQFRVKLSVWECEPQKYPATGKIRRWVGLRGLSQFPMPSGSAKIVEKLRG